MNFVYFYIPILKTIIPFENRDNRVSITSVLYYENQKKRKDGNPWNPFQTNFLNSKKKRNAFGEMMFAY